MIRLIIFVPVVLGFLSCTNNNQEIKEIFDSIKNNSNYIMTLNRDNQNQTVDSIIIFQSGTVTSTGTPIFTITTRSGKRKTDSTNEAKKKEIVPNPFAPVGTYSNYTLSEKSLFSITIYDTSGSEKEKLVNKVLPPGDYDVNYSVYYIMEPNVYLLVTKYNGLNDYRKLIIK